jgi:hypothetical protein
MNKMEDESAELKERISQMSDGELLRIVGPDRNDYVEEAIEFAARELRVRNVPFEKQQRSAPQEPASTDDESVEESAVAIAPCDVCRGAMRPGILFADKEVTMLFQDSEQGEEERFVQAFACSICGEVRLVVDFHTEIEH